MLKNIFSDMKWLGAKRQQIMFQESDLHGFSKTANPMEGKAIEPNHAYI